MINIRIIKKAKSTRGSTSSARSTGYASQKPEGSVQEAVHASSAARLDENSPTRQEIINEAVGLANAYTDQQIGTLREEFEAFKKTIVKLVLAEFGIITQESWTISKLVSIDDAKTNEFKIIDKVTAAGNTYYIYNAGYNEYEGTKIYINPNTGEAELDNPPLQHGLRYTSNSYLRRDGIAVFPSTIPDGWYRKENQHGNYPAEIYNHAGADEDVIQIYCLEIYKYENGRMTDYAEVYFRDKGDDISLEEGKGRLTRRDGQVLIGNYPYLYSYYKNEIEQGEI